MNSYCKRFWDRTEAINYMKLKNRACQHAGNRRDLYVVVDGPEGDYAVVDINTAIDMDAHYEWAA